MRLVSRRATIESVLESHRTRASTSELFTHKSPNWAGNDPSCQRTIRSQVDSQDEVPLSLVPLAVLLGALGGVLGASFNACWVRLQRARQGLARWIEFTLDDAPRRSADDRSKRKAALSRVVLWQRCAKVCDAVLGVALTSSLFYGVVWWSSSWACVARDARRPTTASIEDSTFGA